MMTASARHAESPHAADALHKMAAAASARSAAGGDENAPANGNKPTAKKADAPKQQSESDDNGDDDDEEDDEDDETGKAKSVASSASATDKAGGDDDDKKASSKKSRRELPPHTVAILKGWMLSPEHVKHPYPTDEDKQMLLKKTGINMKQLTNWFTNARKRIWKPMMRREHSRQLQTAMEYEKTRGPPAPFPMAPPMAYRDAAYPPRPAIRHSFDAGSLGGPPHPRDAMGYAPPHGAYDGMAHPHAPPPPHGAYPAPPPHAYPPRVMRSVSESATRHDMDDYIDAMRIRKRVHEMAPEGVDADGSAGHADKRFRRGATALSPRCAQILHEWVAAHAHMEYPTPADADKLQLSRDTGLDVQQIELWFKTNVGRHGALLQPPPPTAQPPQAPMPHGHPAYRSIPSRDNPLYPPPPAYGERRSIPSHGNPMFPPRPTARSSIPGAGNPQFPPPPGVRRDSSEGYRGGMPPPPGYPGASGVYPPPPHNQGGYDAEAARPMRTLSINSAQYASSSGSAAVPMPSIPAPVGAPGANGASGLPSLTGRPLPGRAGGPPMGQARDSRSHTLDMGQFADARRRKMNFQDILASTSSPQLPPARPAAGDSAYPSEVPASYTAQKVYDQQPPPSRSTPTLAPSADPQAPGSRI